MSSIETRCDACKHEFTLEVQNFNTARIRSVDIQYFMCEKCKEVYITKVEDDYILKQQKKIKKYLRNGEYELSTRCRERLSKHMIAIRPQLHADLKIFLGDMDVK